MENNPLTPQSSQQPVNSSPVVHHSHFIQMLFVGIAMIIVGLAIGYVFFAKKTTSSPTTNQTTQIVPTKVQVIAPTTMQPAECQPANLTATVGGQGATGSTLGQIIVKNMGNMPCHLTGHPQVQLVDNKGDKLTVNTTIPSEQPAQIVTLQPNQHAIAMIQWFNWCGAYKGPVTVKFSLPNGTSFISAVDSQYGGFTEPRCDTVSSSSTLAVGNFTTEIPTDTQGPSSSLPTPTSFH